MQNPLAHRHRHIVGAGDKGVDGTGVGRILDHQLERLDHAVIEADQRDVRGQRQRRDPGLRAIFRAARHRRGPRPTRDARIGQIRLVENQHLGCDGFLQNRTILGFERLRENHHIHIRNQRFWICSGDRHLDKRMTRALIGRQGEPQCPDHTGHAHPGAAPYGHPQRVPRPHHHVVNALAPVDLTNLRTRRETLERRPEDLKPPRHRCLSDPISSLVCQMLTLSPHQVEGCTLVGIC
ncbi:Uncharacterised protein [Mycobacteroides abscessus subsp. abscessus]|nr:Uncharacterised protein [Mycobacteroides abscessus subsp. abscessus]